MARYPLKLSWGGAVLIVAIVGLCADVNAAPQRTIVSEGRVVEENSPESARNGRAGGDAFEVPSSENPSDNSIPDTAISTLPPAERQVDTDLTTVPTTTVTDASTPVCKFGKTPAWQFVKCKAKAFARKAKQVRGDAAKWINEKSECLSKISKGAGHAIEQTRQCLMRINIRSRDLDEQLKTCFTGGDNRPENREWNEGVVCFVGLNPKVTGRSPTSSEDSPEQDTSIVSGPTRKQLPEDFP